MTHPLPPLVRRLVLGGALLAALSLAAFPEATPAGAADAAPPAAAVPAAPAPPVAAAPAVPAPAEAAIAREIANAIREATREARQEIAQEAARAAAQAARDARADVEAAADDEAKDAADSGSRDPRAFAFDPLRGPRSGLPSFVVGIVFIVFLTPILIIALVVWYKIRRQRMQNETMLKLAERGVVPSAEALQAVSGAGDASLTRAASALPPAEQVQVLAKRAAWSDLRKGVVMATIGLALSVHSLLGNGRPGWIGLVLLFLGAGYVALWYFEERQTAQTIDALRTTAATPPHGNGGA